MVSYEDAFCIASETADRNGFGLIGSVDQTSGGWIFYTEQPVDAYGLIVPGGPSPIFVSVSGDVREVILPSVEGFAILDDVVKEGVLLPHNLD